MGKKNMRNTKGRIIQAAWRLFYQQGYDDTTVDEIIRERKNNGLFTSIDDFVERMGGREVNKRTLENQIYRWVKNRNQRYYY